MAVRAPPTCRKPVGDGAKRTRTGPWIWMLMNWSPLGGGVEVEASHLLRRQVPGLRVVLEAVVVVAAVAEGLVGGGAAAAEREGGAAAQAVRLAGGIEDLQSVRPLQAERTVLHDGDLDVGHAMASLEDGPGPQCRAPCAGKRS